MISRLFIVAVFTAIVSAILVIVAVMPQVP
jgi:hypothetical protein